MRKAGEQNPAALAFVYALAMDGLIIALLQWLFVLRYLIPNAYKWILFSTISWGAGWLLGNFAEVLIVSLLIHGIILGIIQWAFFHSENVFQINFVGIY